MLLPIKPICERKDMRRDATSLIYIQYCYSSEKRTLLNTEIAIPPNFWSKKKLCITDNLPGAFGDVEHLNSELDRMIRVVQDIVSFAAKNKIEDRGSFVKQTFKPGFNIKTKKLVGLDIMNETFTMGELQKLYEAIYQKKLHRNNFQRKMLSMEIFERLEKKYTGKAHKSPYLYRFRKSKKH